MLCKIAQKYKEIINLQDSDSIHKALETYIAEGNDVNYQGEEGTLLHFVMRQENIKNAELLLENKADIHIKDAQGYTALHTALAHAQYVYLELLVKYQANLNLQDNKGASPIMVCLCNYDETDNKAHAIKFLIDNGADVNIKDNLGLTPINKYFKSGNVNDAVMEVLVKSSAYTMIGGLW